MRGEKVFVDLKLPPAGRVLRLPGEVTNLIQREGNVIHRIGVRIGADAEPAVDLQTYVSSREESILHELELIYETMRRESELRG